MRRLLAAVLLCCLVIASRPTRAVSCQAEVIAYGWTINEAGADSISVYYEGQVTPVYHQLGYTISWRWKVETWTGQQVIVTAQGSTYAGGKEWWGPTIGYTIIDPQWDHYSACGSALLGARVGYYDCGSGAYWITWWHRGGCSSPVIPEEEQMCPTVWVYGPGYFH